MNLFIDAISSNGILIIFDNDRNIIKEKKINIKGNESSSLIPCIDNFLNNIKIKYNDLENIVVVNGPGSFTGIRTIVLGINTINYIIKKNIIALSYFDLFDRFPIIKSSSKRDCFLKESKNSKIQIIENNKLLDFLNEIGINKIYGDTNSEIFSKIKILDKINYSNIIKNIKFENNKRIEPLYIKKPNIS